MFIVASWLKRSNDVGDSTGELKDFGEVTVLYSKWGIHDTNVEKSRKQLNGMEMLRDRRHEMAMKMRELESENQNGKKF